MNLEKQDDMAQNFERTSNLHHLDARWADAISVMTQIKEMQVRISDESRKRVKLHIEIMRSLSL